jgi:mono/diheme cytochrome c family protein
MSARLPPLALVCAALAACVGPDPRAPRSAIPSVATGAVFGPPRPVVAPPTVRRVDDASARRGSGVVLADLDGRRVAYVADEDDARIRVIDVDDERELSRLDPGGVPAELVLLPDGRLLAALRDASQLVVLRGGGTARSKLAVERRIPVPTEPVGLALSPDDATLVVTSGWGRRVTVFDSATFARRAEIAVAREPRQAVFADDGRRVFVSHAVGAAVDVVDVAGSPPPPPKRLAVTGSEEIAERMAGLSTQARSACQGFALAKSANGRIFAPHVLVFAGEAEASSGYGGGSGREAEVFHVPVIDEDAGKVVPESKTLRIGIDGLPGQEARCALPRAATVGKAGLFVTCLGENQVQLFDADALNPQDVHLRTWSVPAGPTAIALDEARARAVVWSQFAHALTTIAIDTGGDVEKGPIALSSLTLEREREDARLAKGRLLFHATTDRRISSDGRACASCHPDGRDDTLVWSSPKGPRQTPMLAGRLEGAAPFGWNGDAPSVALHLVQTVKRLGGTGLVGEDKEALMAYVASLRIPTAAPRDAIAAAAARGAAIFRSEATGCADCHGTSGDLPDGAQHDVKSRAAADRASRFDTPSLRFVGGSAPYFHDGRYPDLRTLLVKSDGKMGHTKQLSPDELADLETYLETL